MGSAPPLAATALVALGGGAGAALRFHFGLLVTQALGAPARSFPWATLGVNLVGSLAMGLLAGALARGVPAEAWPGLGNANAWQLALGVGVLGGFTTFSAFSLDLVTLAGRGAWAAAAAYAALSLIGGVLALAVGLAVARA